MQLPTVGAGVAGVATLPVVVVVTVVPVPVVAVVAVVVVPQAAGEAQVAERARRRLRQLDRRGASAARVDALWASGGALDADARAAGEVVEWREIARDSGCLGHLCEAAPLQFAPQVARL